MSLGFAFDLIGLLLRGFDPDTFLDLADGACQEGRSQNVPPSDGVHVAAEDLLGDGGESGGRMPEDGGNERIAVYGNRPTVAARRGGLDRFSIHPHRRRRAGSTQKNGPGRRRATGDRLQLEIRQFLVGKAVCDIHVIGWQREPRRRASASRVQAIGGRFIRVQARQPVLIVAGPAQDAPSTAARITPLIRPYWSLRWPPAY